MAQNKWLMLAILVLARTTTGYVFQSIGSSGPAIAAAFAIDFLLIGTLIGLFKVPGIVLSLPSGLLGRLLSYRVLIGTSLVVMAAGCLITAAASTYAVAATGRLVTGIGATVTNLYFTKAALDWFAGTKELPFAMALLVNSWPLGIAAGLMTQGGLTLAFGWQTAMLVSGLAGLAGALLILAIYRDAPNRTVPPASGAAALAALSRPEWVAAALLAVIWAALNLGLLLVFGFSPALLAGLGFDLAAAGWLVSLGTWVGIAAIPLGGMLVARYGHADPFILACTAGSAVVFLLMAAWPGVALIYVVFGIVAFAAAGPIMGLPARFFAPANRPAGMGVFFTIYYVLMGVVPPLAGAARDAFGPTAPLLLAAGSMLVSVLAQVMLYRLSGAGGAAAQASART